MSWSTLREKKDEMKRTAANKISELRPPKARSSDAPSEERPKKDLAREGGKDLASGMEILELDFLLSIVENTKDNDKNDVMMRKLNFNELLRRKQLNTIDSNSLKVYAMNEGNLYGKDIQCEAMKELTERTTHNYAQK